MQCDLDLSWVGPDVTSGKGAGDENFPVGTFLISRRNRGHVMAYYDFARCIDDIADDPDLPSEQKLARLAAMGAILRGAPTPYGRQDAAKAEVLHRHFEKIKIPYALASDLIIAFQQDITKSRYADWQELLDYCTFSANPVGRFLLTLHGEASEILPLSDALCTALQVINHLQDVSVDLKRLNRCYIPQDFLAAEGVTVRDIALSHSKPGLRRVFDRMLDEVDSLIGKAATLPPQIRNRRMRFYTAIIVGLSQRLALRLRREDPVADRVKLSIWDVVQALSSAARRLI